MADSLRYYFNHGAWFNCGKIFILFLNLFRLFVELCLCKKLLTFAGIDAGEYTQSAKRESIRSKIKKTEKFIVCHPFFVLSFFLTFLPFQNLAVIFHHESENETRGSRPLAVAAALLQV